MKILHGQLEDSLKKAKIKSEAIGKWEILAYACLSFCFLVNGYDNIDNTFLHGVTWLVDCHNMFHHMPKRHYPL